MDREILFRGKLLYEDDWAYGYFVKGGTRSCIVESLASYPRYDIEPNTLGQYTGQTDKNGTKIFEGDIVLTDGLINTKVVWDTDRLMWGLEYPKGEKVALYSFEKWDIEVVGNIYDNYELLTHQHEDKGENK